MCCLACSRCTGYRPILDAFRVFAKGDSAAYTEEAIAASKGLQPGHAHGNGAHTNGHNGSNGHSESNGHVGSNGHGHTGANGHANGNGAKKPTNGKNGKSNGQKVRAFFQCLLTVKRRQAPSLTRQLATVHALLCITLLREGSVITLPLRARRAQRGKHDIWRSA